MGKAKEIAELGDKLTVSASGTTITGGVTSTNIPEVDLAIAPEVLEIQIDAPGTGQNPDWLWTWEQSTLPYARRTITNSPEVSVPLYKQGTYVINNFAKSIHGSMTQTHTLYFKWIDGAGTENLVSWVTDSGTVSDSHPDIDGGNTLTVQRLNISVPSTITLPTLTAPTTVEYDVSNNGTGAYSFSGDATGDNPNIGPLYRGGTYTFNITATGHPFYFTTDNGTNFASGTYFGEYTNGVTGSRTDNGTVTFTVPNNAPDTLYYQCGNHSPMRGAITVKDLAVEVNNNGNYVLYAQHDQEGHKTPIEIRPIPSLVNQMCIVYDASVNKFVPQDLATYVENTPSFENKIREVAGTATLVDSSGNAVVPRVNIYNDSTYLPLVGNESGDMAFATDINAFYVWDGSAWEISRHRTSDTLTEGSTNLYYTDARVANYLSANDYDTATNIVASITDSAPATLDTLNELAAALGDDPNFATTTANSIATKVSKSGDTMTGNLTVDNQVRVSNGTGFLYMAHDGLNGAISNNTGNLLLYAQGNQQIIAHTDGSQRLLINNSRALFKTAINSGLEIHSPTANNSFGDENRIDFYMSNEISQSTGAPAARIASFLERGNNGYGLKFAVRTDGSTFSTAMTIDADKNIDVNSITLQNNGVIKWGNGGTSIGALSYGSSKITLEANSTNTDIAILPSGTGNVGIGTTGPSTKLHVYGTSGNQYIRAESTANNTRSALLTFGNQSNGTAVQGFFGSVGDANQVEVASTSNHPLRIYTNNSPNIGMIMDTSGQVGLNTTGPTARLHVREAVSDTISPATALAKFEGTAADGLAFGNTQSPPFASWIQAGYLLNTYSPTFNNGYPIALNPVGGNVGIGTTNPSEELHVYDAGNDPYVLVDGSGGNRDSGYKINAGNGVKIAVRADAGGGMYFADNAISVTGSIGNSQYRTVIVDSEIQVGGRPGVTNSNPARAIVARMIEAQELNSGYAMLSGQGDTLTGYARRKNSGTGSGTFFFGPYGAFPSGQFTALFRLKISVVSSGGLGYIDVVGSGTTDPTGNNPRPRILNLSTSSFSVDGQYQYFALDFDRTTNGGSVEFRWISANDNADCYVDHILVLPRLNH